MPFQKGHKLSVGNKGGRKTKAEELAEAIKFKEKKIKQKALNDLSRSKVFTVINESDDKQTAKDFALPIVLRSMTENKSVKVEGIVYLPNVLIEKNESTPSTRNDSKG